MNLINTPLKPLELSGSRPAARSHLLPTDMSGILTHSRRGRPAPSPLIDPARPGYPGRPNTPHDVQLIEQTRKWVAQTFFGTLLKQMRNSPFKSPLFEGGRGGEAFGELYDERLIDHMSRGVGNKLVMAIARKIEHKESAAAASAAYARQKIRGPAAAAAPRNGAGADPEGKGGGRSSPQKRRTPAPASESHFQKVRAHVASGL